MSEAAACLHPGCGRRSPHQHCAVCERAFMSSAVPSPATCGSILCRARHDWGPEDWAGRARMARARRDSGIELDDLDREALGREPPDH
jgi:hypothetical protein